MCDLSEFFFFNFIYLREGESTSQVERQREQQIPH